MGRFFKPALRRARSVRDDWFAWLPAEKDSLFVAAAEQLEISYGMLSVALDDTLSLRRQAQLGLACSQAGMCADLCDLLAARLLAALRALEDHGRHFGTLPNVTPLNPDFFRGPTAKRLARMDSLLRVVLSSRSRFFHKLHTLVEAVDDLRQEFRAATEEVAEGAAVDPAADWEALDVLHYDLNTCLRETLVVLKSFLCALPQEQVQPFGQKLSAGVLPLPAAVRSTRGSR